MGNDKGDRFNRGARTYIEKAVKAASHPLRDQILRSLKNGPLSTIDLEEQLGESRYNLYHHLDVLTAVLCLLLALQQDVVNSLRKSWGLYQLLVYKSLYHYLGTELD